MKLHIRHDIVRGAPFTVNGRTFVPEARVMRAWAAEAMFGTGADRAAGFQIVRLRPAALIEQRADGERRHRVEDVTRGTLLGMSIVAALAPILLTALARWIAARLAAA